MAFVVSIALIGSAVGAWFAGQLADTFGRRRVMLIAAVLFAASAVGTAFPPSVELLMFWRLVGGAGIGVASVVAPMYIAEIAPAHCADAWAPCSSSPSCWASSPPGSPTT